MCETVKSVWDFCIYYLFRSFDYSELSDPHPSLVLIHMCQRGGGGGENSKLSVLSVYRLYQVGRFLSTWRCRVQSGGNNTFECSAEWATIAVVCKQCGPGLGSGHRTQLPGLQPAAPVRLALRLYLWHTCHSHKFIHTHSGRLNVPSAASGSTLRYLM